MSLKISEIFNSSIGKDLKLPLFISKIKAGFPSPADDYIDKKLDLNEYCIRHPASTFFVRVEGESMIEAGIHSGDILIVDRSLEAQNNEVVIAAINGELTVKRIQRHQNKIFLTPENPDFKPIEVTREMDFFVWGVVTYVIHSLE